MKKVGFIGLGNMGSKMVINLLNANHEVVGFDINEKLVDQLVSKGLKKASNLSEITNDIDIKVKEATEREMLFE